MKRPRLLAFAISLAMNLRNSGSSDGEDGHQWSLTRRLISAAVSGSRFRKSLILLLSVLATPKLRHYPSQKSLEVSATSAALVWGGAEEGALRSQWTELLDAPLRPLERARLSHVEDPPLCVVAPL
jgi:hypothetical protein